MFFVRRRIEAASALEEVVLAVEEPAQVYWLSRAFYRNDNECMLAIPLILAWVRPL